MLGRTFLLYKSLGHYSKLSWLYAIRYEVKIKTSFSYRMSIEEHAQPHIEICLISAKFLKPNPFFRMNSVLVILV
jgi:hypothetical protein